MFNLYKESREIAQEAWEESNGDIDEAHDFIHQTCDSHEIVIYYHKAIQFCADCDTSDGEAFLDDCGGIAQGGDSFGQIACRIAFATLYCASQSALYEIQEESEND
jgi:hypothetical protein